MELIIDGIYLTLEIYGKIWNELFSSLLKDFSYFNKHIYHKLNINVQFYLSISLKRHCFRYVSYQCLLTRYV